jgi:hypothetical protein
MGHYIDSPNCAAQLIQYVMLPVNGFQPELTPPGTIFDKLGLKDDALLSRMKFDELCLVKIADGLMIKMGGELHNLSFNASPYADASSCSIVLILCWISS